MRAFSWLFVCSGLFMSSTSGTVCPTELSLCINPARSFWQLCSGRETLQCLTGWHPLPGWLNTDETSSSWTKYTECESSSQPTFRCLISESLSVLRLGFMEMGLHQLSGAADWIAVFHCGLNRKYYYRAAKKMHMYTVSQHSKPQSCPLFLCCFALVWSLIYAVVWILMATVSWWVPVVYIPNCSTPSHSLYLNTFQRCAKGSEKGKEELNHLVLLPCCSVPHQAFCALLGDLWTVSLPLPPICTVGLQLLATFALCLR